jgi:phosphatidylinositol kinase/protein kinase (PI-3  family)
LNSELLKLRYVECIYETSLTDIPIRSSSEYTNRIFRKAFADGTKFECPPRGEESEKILHPFRLGAEIESFKVVRVFSSAMKPILAECKCTDGTTDLIIIKSNDVLDKDVATLNLFRLMNSILRHEQVTFRERLVQAYCYSCCSLADDLGAVECVRGAIPVKSIEEKFTPLTTDQHILDRMMRTGSAGMMFAYILGIRDRHHNNILLIATDSLTTETKSEDESLRGTMFQIDFGFVVGDSPFLDANPIGATEGFKNTLNTEWEEFICLCIRIFFVLRKHAKMIIEVAALAFADIVPEQKTREFLTNRLLLNVNDCADVSREISEKIAESPSSIQTKSKNSLSDTAEYLRALRKQH